MKRTLFSLAVAAAMAIATLAAAATPEQEAQFVNAYKAAFDAQDAATLESFLFTDGAIPAAVEFYKTAMTAEFGQKITTIELQPLDAQDSASIGATMPGPDGSLAKLAPAPYKKLVIKIDTKDANGTMSSTSTIFIAEKDGKIGVSLPVPAN
jgi:hypothetical protein